MTPLPKHLEEMRNELAAENISNYIKSKRQAGNLFKDITDEHIYRLGFDIAASILLKDMEEMAKALESIKLAGHSDHAKMRIVANEALKIWREKYGVE